MYFSIAVHVFLLQQILFRLNFLAWKSPAISSTESNKMYRLRSLLLVIALDLVAATLICPSKTTADDVLQEQILVFMCFILRWY